MPRRALRSRSLRKLVRKTPGGRLKKVFGRRRPNHSLCSGCSSKLHGTPRERPFKIGKLSLTQKRPKRKYGGNLCSKCTRKSLKHELLRKFNI